MNRGYSFSGIPGSIFTREDFYHNAKAHQSGISNDAIAYALKRRLASGEIVHIGWNRYMIPAQKKSYDHTYTETANHLAQEISQAYPEIDFQLFELFQMNEFVNHQIAHNTIIVSVESNLVDYVFDSLIRSHPGHVMLKPTVADYYRYLTDNQIVVTRLPSQSPKGIILPWKSRLEKILVDIYADKFLSSIIPHTEYENIYQTAFEEYIIDRSTMLRYAKRKGAVDKVNLLLNKYAPSICD